MAQRKNITTTSSNTTAQVDEPIGVPETAIKSTEKRKFSTSDLIPCISITPGEMFFIGDKTKKLYTWADADDIAYIEYCDLAFAVRAKNKMVYKPRFIIQDGDFLSEFHDIEEIYGSLYSTQDLKNILKLSPSQMEKEINTLPEGAKDSLKHIAATMIDNGTFDSAQRIKILDKIFGTNMLIKLASM